MLKIIVISDVHLGNSATEPIHFFNMIESLDTDLLILNGDIYDLYIDKPNYDIYELIKSNKNIKEYIHILGNHDADLGKYFPNENYLSSYEIKDDDLVFIHGHQADFISENLQWLEKWLCKLRNLIFDLTLCDITKVTTLMFSPIITWFRYRMHKKIGEMYPNKTVIMGHTHLDGVYDNVINCGKMTNKDFSYVEIRSSDDKLIVAVIKGII